VAIFCCGATIMSERLIDELRAALGTQAVLTRPGDLWAYAGDGSIAEAEALPLAVALPASTDEVARAMSLAHQARVPVVTRGAGSGLAGGAVPSGGSLVLALTRMHAFAIDRDEQTVTAQAGAITGELQAAAEAQGLFYPPDPSSLGVSTIGGNIACNAGGPRCVKYGVTADYVLALTAVLADGRVLRLGGVGRQTHDFGLLQVLIGSEGTLAIITEATLRLIAKPVARRTVLAIFANVEDACAAVADIMAGGVLPAGLELMDDTSINTVEDYLHLGLPRDAGALLLMLADGEPEAVADEAAAMAEVARRHGAREVQVARNAADEAALWRARRSVSPSLARLRPNKLGEDICVPVPRIAQTVRGIKQIAHQHQLLIPVFGHAGDGNLHPNILFDARDPIETARVWPAAAAIFRLALDMGGTLSGEHGIGTLKRPFMLECLGLAVVSASLAVKRAFDPLELLNPGKVFAGERMLHLA
jgi:glycolate oxidase subunit GlcD